MLVRWCRTDDWRLFWLDSEKTGHRRLWKVSFFCPLSLVGHSLIHSVLFLWVWSFRVGDSHSKRGSHLQGPRKTYRMVEPCQVTSQWSPATSSPHCSATLKKIFQRFLFRVHPADKWNSPRNRRLYYGCDMRDMRMLCLSGGHWWERFRVQLFERCDCALAADQSCEPSSSLTVTS